MRTPTALTLALVAAGSAALGATAASGTAIPNVTAKPIGYIYAGTINSGIETLAVHSDHTLKLVHTTPLPAGATAVGGVTLVHTKAGLKLYVLAGAFAQAGSIYTYSVSPTTGALTKSTAKVNGIQPVQGGNNLFSWDGQAQSAGDGDAVYASTCVGAITGGFCSSYGVGLYDVNQKTGALKLAATPTPAKIWGISVAGDRMNVLVAPPTLGTAILPIKIDHVTGRFTNGPSFDLVTNDNPPQPTTATMLATSPTSVAVGPMGLGVKTPGSWMAVYSSTGTKILKGGNATKVDPNTSTMAFIPHTLLIGGYDDTTFGPKLQLVSPSGQTTGGTIDLTKAPYHLSSGASFDPYGVETIFQLGKGIYIGNYFNPVVQATDGVGGKGFTINQTHPIVANTGAVTSMAGFLLPAVTKTTIALHRQGTKLIVSGAVSGGKPGVHVTVTLLTKKGTKYVPNAKKAPALSSKHRYSATFSDPSAAKCEATARYPGTSTTRPSSATLQFAC
jgi:hypothetical protein